MAVPALSALPAPAQTPALPRAAGSTPDNFNVASVAPDAVARPNQQFFSKEQMSALKRLGEILVPKVGDRPGSPEANAAEFLDFLISQSPQDRQMLYRNGLDRLNVDAQKMHEKPFAALSPDQAASILKPLNEPWTYGGSPDLFAQFLISAKEDFLRATVNSRAYATALAATTRGAGGMNYYWYPIE